MRMVLLMVTVRGRIGIGVGALLLGLSGCQLTQHPTGQPVVIQRDGSNIVVAVCADLEVEGITMQQREYPGAWETFWEFEKTMDIHDGDEISPSNAEELGVSEGTEPEMTANREIAVFLDGELKPGWGNVTATFLIGEEGLSETMWLHDDETVSAQPCS